MMNDNNYLIDYSGWFDEGGYCQVYPIKGHKHLVFKEFINKKKAIQARSLHTKLARYDLAPRIFSKICKLNFCADDGWEPDQSSDWGYITEYAKTCSDNSSVKMEDIQNLVEEIHDKTGLKFWDCHWYNIGYVKRGKNKKLVCIDTGKESFNGMANAWGFSNPGPKCCYCNKYQCRCSE